MVGRCIQQSHLSFSPKQSPLMEEARADPAATLASQGMEKGTLGDRIASEYEHEALVLSFF